MPKVRSVCEHPDGRVLVGTRASEIFEFTNQGNDRKILNRGHYDYELWGLCQVPGEPNMFLTCGMDFMLAKWNTETHEQVNVVEIKYQAKTLDCNPDSGNIAVGCSNGRVLIYDKDLCFVTEIKNRNKEISIVKYSSDGQYLAVGGHDTRIYIYPTGGTRFKAKGVLKGHHSTITHIDWSEDSTVLQSNS
jgi:WD40 repeat protein